MLDLKTWQKWFVRKGYDSNLADDGSEMVIILPTCSVSLQADGLVYINGFVEVGTKTGLWQLINTLGLVK